MKILVLPTWLETAVLASGKDLDVVLNVKELLTILSKEDVAFYIHVNEPAGIQKLVSKEVSATFETIGFNLVQQLTDSNVGVDPEVADRVFRCLDSICFSGPDKQPTKLSLLSEHILADIDANKRVEVTYECSLLTADTVVLKPQVIEQSQFWNSIKPFYSKLLNILCSTSVFTQVVQTALFKDYVKYSQYKSL